MSLKIGWIGCGRHATQMLLPQLGRNDVQISALCDVSTSAAARAARQFGVTSTCSDYRDLIGHRGLDAIGMAVGPDLHRVASIEALKRGLPVFVEKPPAASRAGAEEILRASEQHNKPVVVGFMKRYSTGNAIARNVLRKPEFGRILGICATYMTAPTYFSGEKDYTSFFLHHCIHYMDLMPWLAGADIADMALRKIEVEPGHLLLHLNFACENQAIGTVIMGTVQSRGTPMESIQIMGDHSRVEVQNIINVAYYRNPPFKADDPSATLTDDVDTLTWTPNFTAAANEDHKGYNALMADAVAAMKGEENNAPTISEGVHAMKHLETMIGLLS